MAKIKVDNRNREHARFCYTSTGESVQIGPGAKGVPVDDKFLWKMDPDIVQSRSSMTVFETEEEIQARTAPVEITQTVSTETKEDVSSPTH